MGKEKIRHRESGLPMIGKGSFSKVYRRRNEKSVLIVSNDLFCWIVSLCGVMLDGSNNLDRM
jgi:hypothetical protein